MILYWSKAIIFKLVPVIQSHSHFKVDYCGRKYFAFKMLSSVRSLISVLALPLRGRSGSCRVMCRKMLFAYFVVFSFLSISASVLRTPEFAEPIKNGTMQVGSDVEFSCDVRHLGTYRVAWSWKKDDDQKFLGIGIVKIVSDSRIHISRIQKSDDVTQFNLYIYNIKKEDAGTYHCSVNSNPMIEQIGTLDVVENEYANGHNGKIVNGKSVAIPPKPVRKGIDSSSSSLGTDHGENQRDANDKSLQPPSTSAAPLEGTFSTRGEERNSLSSTNSNSESDSNFSIFCIDLREIWDSARERIADFLSSIMRFTYSYIFS